jgi:hypothetical protein
MTTPGTIHDEPGHDTATTTFFAFAVEVQAKGNGRLPDDDGKKLARFAETVMFNATRKDPALPYYVVSVSEGPELTPARDVRIETFEVSEPPGQATSFTTPPGWGVVNVISVRPEGSSGTLIATVALVRDAT